MSSRPTHTPTRGPSFKINVPAGWYAIVTAISRKQYMQALEVSFDIVVPDARIFGSSFGKNNDLMKITLDNTSSLPFKEQEDAYDLEFKFYYSKAEKKNAENLVDNQELSTRIHPLRTEKTPGSFKGPDNVTYFVFVEDTPNQEANTGQYDDAVAMIYLVEKL
ncbi:hypothetical protein BDZ94DRAFT_1165856 [Collybia nuda]|uniref:Uncharacterized protein n=1 Tax=Collybia nuda TaxID=64659 RepID=A0A9P5Y652_9AGAR|nr:hypothetical protein BDZ94DRAFT_1165856 [Collybia nuda]